MARRLTTNQEIAGSTPASVNSFFFLGIAYVCMGLLVFFHTMPAWFFDSHGRATAVSQLSFYTTHSLFSRTILSRALISNRVE